MRFNIEFVLGIAYIAGMVGIAWAHVGELSGPSEPFSWWLPIGMLTLCGFPFVLGYLAGRDD